MQLCKAENDQHKLNYRHQIREQASQLHTISTDSQLEERGVSRSKTNKDHLRTMSDYIKNSYLT